MKTPNVSERPVGQAAPAIFVGQAAPAIFVLWLLALGTVSATAQPALEGQEISDNAMILVGAPEGPPREGAALERILEEVASRMRCPVCQGLSIAASHTDTAIAMKAEAKQLLAAGYSPEQTFRYFEASYGEFIRLEPKAEGFNLLVWIAPAAIVLVGALIVFFRVRHKETVPAAGEDASPPEVDPELAAYLEQVRSDVSAAPREEAT